MVMKDCTDPPIDRDFFKVSERAEDAALTAATEMAASKLDTEKFAAQRRCRASLHIGPCRRNENVDLST